MNHSVHALGHATAPSTPTAPDREQNTPRSVDTERVLNEIARLANELCEHLADDPWCTAAQIRDLAETALAAAGDL
ncbi:hypothetical protein ACFY12_20950 [Streptomyces sp. NPDC001339]|uniref:hypothetical protein n=1 Tax=Streptomyces sp. NPDC001339 TaxID=3364563 RepID=UPI0036780302